MSFIGVLTFEMCHHLHGRLAVVSSFIRFSFSSLLIRQYFDVITRSTTHQCEVYGYRNRLTSCPKSLDSCEIRKINEKRKRDVYNTLYFSFLMSRNPKKIKTNFKTARQIRAWPVCPLLLALSDG